MTRALVAVCATASLAGLSCGSQAAFARSLRDEPTAVAASAFPRTAAVRATRGLAARLYASDPDAFGYDARCGGPSRSSSFKCEAIIRKRISQGFNSGTAYRCFYPVRVVSVGANRVRARLVGGGLGASSDTGLFGAEC